MNKKTFSISRLLQSHPDVKESYDELKEKLAKQFPYDIESYINGKDRLFEN